MDTNLALTRVSSLFWAFLFFPVFLGRSRSYSYGSGLAVARHPRRGLSQQCAGPSTAPITTFPFQVAFDLEFHTFPPPNLAAVVDAMDEANVSSPHIGWKLSVNTSAATSAQDWMLVFQWGAEGGAALQSQPLSNTGWATGRVFAMLVEANGSGTVQVVRDGSLLGAPVATLDWAGFSPLPLVYLQDTCCSERDLNATVCATDSSTTTTTTPIPTTINPCPIGMYGSAPSCVGCPAGRYGSEMAASAACDGPCAPGYYCPTGSTSPQAVPCPEGSWSPLGESSPYCVACQAGRYGSTEAMSDPTCTGICQPGYYCLDRSTMPNLTVCPLGSWSTFGEVSPYCQACPEGRYGNGISTDSNCSGPCDPGFTCPERSISPKGDTNTSTSRTTPVVVIVLAVILGAAVCAMLVLGADAEGRRRTTGEKAKEQKKLTQSQVFWQKKAEHALQAENDPEIIVELNPTSADFDRNHGLTRGGYNHLTSESPRGKSQESPR